jgi:hypothetical protein
VVALFLRKTGTHFCAQCSNPKFGICDIADVSAQAIRNGQPLNETIPMPANHFSMAFHKK